MGLISWGIEFGGKPHLSLLSTKGGSIVVFNHFRLTVAQEPSKDSPNLPETLKSALQNSVETFKESLIFGPRGAATAPAMT